MNNREAYKKAFDKITMPQNLEKEILEMTNKPKKTVWKAAVAFTTMAAVLCLFVFGALPQLGGGGGSQGNSFVLQAFAMEVQTSEPLTINLSDLIDDTNRNEIIVVTVDAAALQVRGSGDNPFTLHDNVAVLRIDLRSWGTNIESVEYFVDDGFFVDGRFHPEMGGVEILGSEIIISGNELGDDFSLNFGMRLPDLHSDQITVSATSTFIDGSQEERIIIIEIAEIEAATGIDSSLLDRNWVEPAEYLRVMDTVNAEMRNLLAANGEFGHFNLSNVEFFNSLVWDSNTNSVDFESFTGLTQINNGESQIWYTYAFECRETGGFLFEISRNNDQFTVRFIEHVDYIFTPPVREPRQRR